MIDVLFFALAFGGLMIGLKGCLNSAQGMAHRHNGGSSIPAADSLSHDNLNSLGGQHNHVAR